VTISAIDETFSQLVHTRFSYANDEIVHGARFSDIFDTAPDGAVSMDLARISEFDRVTLPSTGKLSQP